MTIAVNKNQIRFLLYLHKYNVSRAQPNTHVMSLSARGLVNIDCDTEQTTLTDIGKDFVECDLVKRWTLDNDGNPVRTFQ